MLVHLVPSTKYTSTISSTSACTSSTCTSPNVSVAHMATGGVGGKCIPLLVLMVLVPVLCSAITCAIASTGASNTTTSSYLYKC